MLLEKLKIEKVRNLPSHNKTSSKSKAFVEYYLEDEVKNRAIKVFYWFMKHWGYEFPNSWNANLKIPSKFKYSIFNLIKKFYWKYLR